MAASLVFAGIADFYLAHHGSLQHKIAWMSNCQGVVHSNQQVLAAPGRYPGVYAKKEGVMPHYLAADQVEDREGAEDVPGNRWIYDLANYEMDYRYPLAELRSIAKGLKRPRDTSLDGSWNYVK